MDALWMSFKPDAVSLGGSTGFVIKRSNWVRFHVRYPLSAGSIQRDFLHLAKR